MGSKIECDNVQTPCHATWPNEKTLPMAFCNAYKIGTMTSLIVGRGIGASIPKLAEIQEAYQLGTGFIPLNPIR